jgi:glycosyltransferase involved in cell wall biosynthesis
MLKNKKIIISCSNAASLINFRGRLIETLVMQNMVYVITPVIESSLTREKLLEMGVQIFETDLNRNSISVVLDLKYTYQVFRILREVKPDLFFAYTFKPIIFGTIMATLCRVPNINAMLTGLGYSFTPTAKKSSSFIIQNLLKFSLRLNKNLKVIFQNSDDYNELEKSIISSKTKAFVVNGSGVDLTHYEFSVPDVSNITFLMMSRLIKSKGVYEYFEAASIIKKKYSHVKFVLAGGYKKGETDCIDEDLFNKIENGVIIDYLGWVTDIRSQIKQSTTVVLPSFYREGVPRSLLEALAMGRSIITTEMIGCKETIDHTAGKVNGFTIPVKDAASLASKMEYLITNPSVLIEMGKNGRILAEEKFDVEKVNTHMIEIFESGRIAAGVQDAGWPLLTN